VTDKLNGLALATNAFEDATSTRATTNIRNLRLSQDFEASAEVTQVVTNVAIGKPNRHTFFRVHPEWAVLYWVLELKGDMRSDYYIVDLKAVPELEAEVSPRRLVPLITRDGALYLWPLRIPTAEKKFDAAGASAHAAAQKAKESWIRLVWAGKQFDAFVAKTCVPDPIWPDTTFDEMIEIAFAGKVIESPQHPVVKALNGEQ
jgi:hypothetical protein